eukprot:CAMPEP_0206144516 /NCGR_PEP_ID=MMETSP1473-20131121/24340_1 /ASSEMBLY_ACC=CAM_ASM_001109 /TAXON_ID=1461547 /ORGANISM="Stichococcus sp, Strain RCC1054" /LENGTH=38 /DNA_ID= /DNA_START= /DNA_END= /DNA_ORIENTATION=
MLNLVTQLQMCSATVCDLALRRSWGLFGGDAALIRRGT